MAVERKTQEFHQETLTLKRFAQVAINDSLGIRIGKRKENCMAIIATCPLNWPISISTIPHIRLRSKSSDEIREFHFSLPEKETAQIGIYTLTVESIGPESKITVESPVEIKADGVRKNVYMVWYISKRRKITSRVDSQQLQ